MTRMSREFSLVLLGSGILTAGYFVASENEDVFKKEEEQAQQQLTGKNSHGYRPGGFIFIHGGGFANGRATSPAMAGGAVGRGFGSIGAHTAGG